MTEKSWQMPCFKKRFPSLFTDWQKCTFLSEWKAHSSPFLQSKKACFHLVPRSKSLMLIRTEGLVVVRRESWVMTAVPASTCHVFRWRCDYSILWALFPRSPSCEKKVPECVKRPTYLHSTFCTHVSSMQPKHFLTILLSLLPIVAYWNSSQMTVQLWFPNQTNFWWVPAEPPIRAVWWKNIFFPITLLALRLLFFLIR